MALLAAVPPQLWEGPPTPAARSYFLQSPLFLQQLMTRLPHVPHTASRKAWPTRIPPCEISEWQRAQAIQGPVVTKSLFDKGL